MTFILSRHDSSLAEKLNLTLNSSGPEIDWCNMSDIHKYQDYHDAAKYDALPERVRQDIEDRQMAIELDRKLNSSGPKIDWPETKTPH